MCEQLARAGVARVGVSLQPGTPFLHLCTGPKLQIVFEGGALSSKNGRRKNNRVDNEVITNLAEVEI